MKNIMISVIVAHDRNRAIGADNSLLWHISDDLKYFKRVTEGHPVIMGRNTFDSIGRPLPGRRNIVVSRTMSAVDGIEVFNDLDAALAAAVSSDDEIFVIGGGSIYAQTVPHADRFYITEVDTEASSPDTYFPDYSEYVAGMAMEDDGWMRDEASGLMFRFVRYFRK